MPDVAGAGLVRRRLRRRPGREGLDRPTGPARVQPGEGGRGLARARLSAVAWLGISRGAFVGSPYCWGAMVPFASLGWFTLLLFVGGCSIFRSYTVPSHPRFSLVEIPNGVRCLIRAHRLNGTFTVVFEVRNEGRRFCRRR